VFLKDKRCPFMLDIRHIQKYRHVPPLGWAKKAGSDVAVFVACFKMWSLVSWTMRVVWRFWQNVRNQIKFHACFLLVQIWRLVNVTKH
jgi:hypothetical protein